MASLREEFLAGVRAELPLLLGVVPFGMIFGVLGLAAGLPGWAVDGIRPTLWDVAGVLAALAGMAIIMFQPAR